MAVGKVGNILFDPPARFLNAAGFGQGSGRIAPMIPGVPWVQPSKDLRDRDGLIDQLEAGQPVRQVPHPFLKDQIAGAEPGREEGLPTVGDRVIVSDRTYVLVWACEP